KNKYKGKNEGSQFQGSKNEHGESSKNDNGKTKKSKKHIQCYNCQKYGHYASECKGAKVPRKKNNEDTIANMADQDNEPEIDPLLMMA
ncbi:retrovirus-related Pol polyprotein from transposon TNT 1-94, partial [Trifolium medium]|nr:retrovirus-related Pol polyprotein from transposon TNT 1-94 [Trifolium medium]